MATTPHDDVVTPLAPAVLNQGKPLRPTYFFGRHCRFGWHADIFVSDDEGVLETPYPAFWNISKIER